MFARVMLMLATVPFLLAACAGPQAPPKGPHYYVTGDVVKVVYNQKDGQVACERESEPGSHVKEGYCYTYREIVAQNDRNRRDNELFGMLRCPEPSLCKTSGGQ